MNQNPGVIGRKLGMTQLFEEDGTVIPCTVIESNPVVVGKRTTDKDGYDALVLGAEERKDKRVTKPVAGMYKKAGVSPKRVLRELRCSADHVARFEVGQAIKPTDLFEEGQFVDVQGVSRGRGFAGVMRRHNFGGGVATHGTHEYKRHGGSIGQNMTPGRVFPGKKMAGHMGNARLSILNQPIVKIVADENLILVRGSVPGPRNAVVVLRGAVKKKNSGKKPSGE